MPQGNIHSNIVSLYHEPTPCLYCAWSKVFGYQYFSENLTLRLARFFFIYTYVHTTFVYTLIFLILLPSFRSWDLYKYFIHILR